MIYIYLGIVAFIFMLLYDFYTLKNEKYKKTICGIVGATLFIYSTIMLIISSPKMLMPLSIVIIALVIFIISVTLLVYSLFLELPFTKTYVSQKYNKGLVCSGTYALCRHPGVLWFGLLFVSLFFLTGAILVIPAAIIWTGIDILYVYMQEKYIFIKMFKNYGSYIRTTPMIIPNKKSILESKNTIFRGRFNYDKT